MMTTLNRRTLILGTGAAGVGLLAAPAISRAQGTFPRGPITMVVSFAAGGLTAGGAVGVQHAFDQPADGQTLLIQMDASRAFPAMGNSDRTWRDFQMIGVFVIATTIMCVRPDSQLRTATDFVRALREADGRLGVGHAGPGTMGFVAMAALAARENLKYTGVPFQGHAPAQTGLLRGEVPVTANDGATGRELIAGRRIRPLFHFDKQPMNLAGFGEIPALSPQIASLDDLLPLGGWFGPAVKAGTPQPVVERITQAYTRALNDPASAKFAEDNGLLLGRNLVRDEAQRFVERETRQISWLMQDSGAAQRSPEAVNVPRWGS